MTTTTRELRFDTTYLWSGIKQVKLVPLFAMGAVYRVSPNEMVWVFEVDNENNSYHVPARMLEDIC